MVVKTDKKEEYELLRDLYHRKKQVLNNEINSHQLQINKHKEKIRKLEAEIEKSRPRTEQGREICPTCDVISMKYIANTPGDCGTEHWYECEICGYKNYHT